jgi:hypothetical protein
LIAFNKGSKKAAVFPLHVCDSPTMWCPSTKCLNVNSWIGVGIVYPFWVIASRIVGLSHRSANVGHTPAVAVSVSGTSGVTTSSITPVRSVCLVIKKIII